MRLYAGLPGSSAVALAGAERNRGRSKLDQRASRGFPKGQFPPAGARFNLRTNRADLAMRSRSQAMTSAARTSQVIFVLAMTVAFMAMLA